MADPYRPSPSSWNRTEVTTTRRLPIFVVLGTLLTAAIVVGVLFGFSAFAARGNVVQQAECQAAECLPSPESEAELEPTPHVAFVVPALESTVVPSLAPIPTVTPTLVQPTAAVKRSPTRAAAPALPKAPPAAATSTLTPTDELDTNLESDSDDDTTEPCLSSIYGFVETDDGDAVTNATVKLSSSTGSYIKSTPTESDGYYELYDLAGGNYQIDVVPAPGSGLAAPPSHTVTLTECSDEGHDFTLVSAAATATATTTPTATLTAKATGTTTATRTPSRTPTGRATATLTATQKRTATPTRTRTATSTRTLTPTPAKTPASTAKLVFAPTADAYVSQANPNKNYGSATSLVLDSSPEARAYIRFNVQGVTGPITKATLKLYATTSSSNGYAIRLVTDTAWTESGITFATAPSLSRTNLAMGAFHADAWTDVNITSLVRGNGVLNLALVTTGSAQIKLASREASSKAPQIVIVSSP